VKLKPLALALVFALVAGTFGIGGAGVAEAQSNETPSFTPNCLYLPTPLPSPTTSTARILRCNQDGSLVTSSGGGGGGGSVTIIGPLGTTTKAGSVSITIASDQGAIPVSATLSLPFAGNASGAAAAAGQSIGITGFNGTTMDALKSTSGALNVNLSSQTGLSPLIVTTPAPAATGAHGGLVVEGVAAGTVVPISGTVTANAGTGTMAVSLATLPPLAAGSATIGAVTQAAGPWTNNLTQVGGASLALGQTTKSASLPMTLASDQGALAITPPLTGVSGTGTAQAANQALIMACDFNTSLPTITSGNAGPTQCDTAGRLIVVGAGTAGTATGGVVTVQGIAGGTALPVSASGSFGIANPLSSVSGTGTAAGAGQMSVGGCVFTSAFPTITTGNVGPVQCNTSGQQTMDLVSVGGVALGATANYGTSPGTVKALAANAFVTNTVAVTPPLTGVSGTGTASAVNQAMVSSCVFTSALPTITTGNVGPNQCDTNGRQLVVVSAMTTPLTGANSSGTAGAAGQALVADCNYTTAPATVTTGNVVPIDCDSTGHLLVNVLSINGATLGAPVAAGSSAAGNILAVQGVTSGTAIGVYDKATTGGGATLYKFRNLAGTVQAIDASPGTLYSLAIYNGSAATAYVQLFNVATG
jgi:hypothetical protein